MCAHKDKVELELLKRSLQVGHPEANTWSKFFHFF